MIEGLAAAAALVACNIAVAADGVLVSIGHIYSAVTGTGTRTTRVAAPAPS